MRFRLMPLLVLGLLHAYIGVRLLPDLMPNPWAEAAGAGLLLASCALMVTGFLARGRQPRERAERRTALGMRVASLFSSLFVLTLLRDVLLVPASLVLSGNSRHALLGISAAAVVVLAVFVTLVGFAAARRRARVVRVEVPLANLPSALHGFSIAQISDVHVGAQIHHNYVAAIVEAVNDLEADLIAVTGDLVDGSVRDLAQHVAPLGRLSARHGAFVVTGNHEYYSGDKPWIAEFRRLGMRVLLNEHVVVRHDGEPVVVAGVTDYNAHHFDSAHRSDPDAALRGAPAAGARILLAHQPRSAAAAASAGFDLQLSGHTHGGQFWPWTLFVRLQQPFTAGLHRLNDLWVYVSRGTGYWGPPNRFGVPSEITLLTLVPSPE